MPLHVFRPLTQGAYECTFIRRNQITLGNTSDTYATTINNLFLNSFIYTTTNSGISKKFPNATSFPYCTFGEIKITISHLTPICINTIGTTATDLAQFQITPYMIGGVYDDGQFGTVNCKGTYNDFVTNNILQTTSPTGGDIIKANKCFTLSAGQTYTYNKKFPNPPGRFYYKTPTQLDINNVIYFPTDVPKPSSSNYIIDPFVPKERFASIPQSPENPIISIAMQWYDALNASTNKPRLQASAMIETELQMTFYTDSDTVSWVPNNYAIPLTKTTWIDATAPQTQRPVFYRQ